MTEETGTIMFQLELINPIPKDGLVFMLGDPRQSDYFFAFEIINSRPRVTYNFGEKVNTVELKTSQTFDKTKGSVHLRIGSVGGIIGLAIQEWKKHNVVSINDYFIRKPNFRMTNELHFGSLMTNVRTNVSFKKLEAVLETANKPYEGRIGRVKINHRLFDINSAISSNVINDIPLP